MSCVRVKTKIVDINPTVRILYFAVRGGSDCGCVNPNTPLTAVVLRITRKGEDSGTVIEYPAFNRDNEGNIGFFVDSNLYALSSGLYSATVYVNNLACKPYFTLRLGRPCHVSGLYAVTGNAPSMDENPS
jgi:hypothetical protein